MVENRKYVEKLNGKNVMIGLKEKVGREVVRSCYILRHILILEVGIFWDGGVHIS